MRVLVAGLGDIAHKAYLPGLAARPELELHLATRDPAVLAAAAQRFRAAGRYPSVAAALATTRFDAAFVHAATVAHPPLVRLLLDHRVPTLVDKPLADNLAGAEQLVALAKRQRTLLAVGFNRRFAPAYARLRAGPVELITMTKHRHAQPDLPRRVTFDDFIHVIDTLLFLAPGPVRRQQVETRVAGGRLAMTALTLAGDGWAAFGAMHRNGGLDEERVEVVGGGTRRTVADLAERSWADGVAHRQRRGDWTSVGEQRGFAALCDDFLAGVRAGRATAADQIVQTHAFCETVALQAEGADAAPVADEARG